MMLKKKNTEDKIKSFLEENPNFFIDKPELLNKLNFPLNMENTSKNSVVSFKDWMLDTLKSKYTNLISISKHNFFTQKKIFSLILQILTFKNINNFSNFITKKLPTELNLKKVFFASSKGDITKLGGKKIKDSIINHIFNENNVLLMDAVDDEYKLFGKCQKQIYSNAIFSLDYEIFNCPTLLIFGSEDKIFIGNKGTDLIRFLCMVINIKIKQLVKDGRKTQY